MKVGLDILAQIVTPVEQILNQIIVLLKCRLLALTKLVRELLYIVSVLDLSKAVMNSQVPSIVLHFHLL